MNRITTVLSVLLAIPSAQAVELPRLFSDGMVVQRDQPVQVWGHATPGARVAVTFAGAGAVATQADEDGRWSLELPAQTAGGPHVMRIDDGTQPRVLQDVLVGDVWLASGQSNMEWTIAQSADAQAEIARATDPQIRHFKIPRAWAGTPQDQLPGGEWVASSPQAAGSFSAVAHFFARELRKVTGVPIGIIDSTWGGSRIEAWMDAPSLRLDEQALAERVANLQADDERALVQTRQHLARWSLPADDAGWQAPKLKTSTWVPIAVPSRWEAAGWNGMDGVAWYRTTFTLTAEEAAAGVTLGVGRIDDSDTTWVNGTQVGETRMQHDQPRRYTVPASALRKGVNHVAVRVTDTGGGGGIHGEAAEVFVQPQGGATRALADWVFRPSKVSVALDDGKNQHPTLLYNAMIHPLQPYALRGVIWYQGESNADTVADALRYRWQFPALIEQWRAQWRTQWDAPSLPFLWVQLANFSSGKDQGDASPWATLREAQSMTLWMPGAAQAVAIDIGDPADIHPRNKQEVGRRLALAARNVAYGEAVAFHGPVPQYTRFEGNAAHVEFGTSGGTLAVRGGGTRAHGFALAGVDQVFHPAEATVQEGRVVVRSKAVPRPAAVRYGWSDNPADADLINTDQLPASPFRSDNW